MSEPKEEGAVRWTPGPWEFEYRRDNNGTRYQLIFAPAWPADRFQHPYREVCETFRLHRENGEPLREGNRFNAHLIAAAPEMYAALSNARNAIRTLILSDPTRHHWADCIAGDCDDVLAKARGEQP